MNFGMPDLNNLNKKIYWNKLKLSKGDVNCMKKNF